MRKFAAPALVLGVLAGAGAVHANPAAHYEGLVHMGATLTEAAARCKHVSASELAKSRASQRSEAEKLGISAEQFDVIYKKAAAEVRVKMDALTPAQHKTTCDELKAMAGMGQK